MRGGKKKNVLDAFAFSVALLAGVSFPPPVSNSCTGKTDFHIDSLFLFIDVNKMFTGDEIQRTGLNLV